METSESRFTRWRQHAAHSARTTCAESSDAEMKNEKGAWQFDAGGETVFCDATSNLDQTKHVLDRVTVEVRWMRCLWVQ